MPQKDMSKQIGKSSSPVIQRVVENNKNVQAVVKVPEIIKEQFNREPVKVSK